MSDVSNMDQYNVILNNDNLSNNEFHKLKDICSFIPIRTKGKEYQKCCMGLYENKVRDKVVSEEYKKVVFKRYTTEENWFCTRINIYLALDAPILNKYSEYIKELKCCIGWQKPKFSGICYRSANMSPLEIWATKFKDTFYIPSFFSTSTTREVSLRFNGNVLFEIDTTEYNNFTTLIQCDQTVYKENENLISCYNVFKWVGYSYNDGDAYVIVKLKIVSYDKYNDLETHSIVDAKHGDLPLKYAKSGSPEIKNRKLDAKKFNDVFRKIEENNKRS